MSEKKSPVDEYMNDFMEEKWRISPTTDNPFSRYRQLYCENCGEPNCFKERLDIYHCFQTRMYIEGLVVQEHVLQRIWEWLRSKF